MPDTAQKFSLINPRPMLAQADAQIAAAHKRGDIVLELYLIAVRQQFAQLAGMTCVCVFTACCASAIMPPHPRFENRVLLMVRIVYPVRPGVKIKSTDAFPLACREGAMDTAKGIPLRWGDKIRVAGRMLTNEYYTDIHERRSKIYIETAHIELIERHWRNTTADKREEAAAAAAVTKEPETRTDAT